jgi:hypothetical protein
LARTKPVPSLFFFPCRGSDEKEQIDGAKPHPVSGSAADLQSDLLKARWFFECLRIEFTIVDE